MEQPDREQLAVFASELQRAHCAADPQGGVGPAHACQFGKQQLGELLEQQQHEVRVARRTSVTGEPYCWHLDELTEPRGPGGASPSTTWAGSEAGAPFYPAGMSTFMPGVAGSVLRRLGAPSTREAYT